LRSRTQEVDRSGARLRRPRAPRVLEVEELRDPPPLQGGNRGHAEDAGRAKTLKP